MIIYILLIVFSGLMSMIALGLTVGGLIKKNQKLWIGALAAFVVFALLGVFCTYTYVKASIDYMGTDEFQAETKKKAENVGKTWGNTVSGTAQGLEATLDDAVIEKLANKSAKIVGKGVKAIAIGLDETVGTTTVFADASVDNVGIAIGRAERIAKTDTATTFGLFLEFKKDFRGTLTLTAYDSKGLKQDKSEIVVNEKTGNEKVIVFAFKYFHPGLSGYCVLAESHQ